MWFFFGKQLVFMGQEFGQCYEFDELVSFEWFVVDLWGYGGFKCFFCDFNKIYKENFVLWQFDSDLCGFEWINVDDVGNNLFFWLCCFDDGLMIVCFMNFFFNLQIDYCIDLLMEGVWIEIFNIDFLEYDGIGEFGNFG